MADHKILAPFVRYYEGGFSNDKDDPGGATMKGVTLATFRSVYGKNKTVGDLKRITDDQWNTIFKRYYWDKCRGDGIDNQSVANMLVDFAWHSGVTTAVRKIQWIVGTEQDGIMGARTLAAINDYRKGPLRLFDSLRLERIRFLVGCKSWWKYGKGWTKRVNAIGYGTLTYDGKTIKC